MGEWPGQRVRLWRLFTRPVLDGSENTIPAAA